MGNAVTRSVFLSHPSSDRVSHRSRCVELLDRRSDHSDNGSCLTQSVSQSRQRLVARRTLHATLFDSHREGRASPKTCLANRQLRLHSRLRLRVDALALTETL